MRTGAAWADVPSRYPSSSTCYRYFQAWVKAGAFVKILNTLANARVARSTWQYRRHVVPAKKGRCRRERGKGSKIMAIPGLPIAIHVSSASPHESKLVESTIILWRMNPNV
jgi:transposase